MLASRPLHGSPFNKPTAVTAVADVETHAEENAVVKSMLATMTRSQGMESSRRAAEIRAGLTELPTAAVAASQSRPQSRGGVSARGSLAEIQAHARMLDDAARAYMADRNASVATAYDWAQVAALHLQCYGAAAALFILAAIVFFESPR